MLNIPELTEQKRYPSILEFHLGTSCSLRCTFCHRKCKGYCSGMATMSISDLIKLIEEFASLGGKEFYISGGFAPLLAKYNSVLILKS